MANADEFPEWYFSDNNDFSLCWSCECEEPYDRRYYKEFIQWNESNRIIKKGERHTTFPCRKGRYFSEDQTVPYDIFYISKKNGKFRRIFSVYKEKKSKLRELIPYLEKTLLENDVNKVNYAFIRNRNCVEHAMQHIGFQYTVSMDLENFFESVNLDHVSKYLDDYIHDYIFMQCFIFNAPQQGLPTSPLIANLAFLESDQEILYTLKKNNINGVYTRYADDLVVSFDNKKDIGKVIFLISNIVKNSGFTINKKKTKIQNIKNGRIIITGVGIDNKGVYPTRKTLKKIRAAKHNKKNKKSIVGLEEWAKCKLPNYKNQITKNQIRLIK